eukprot:779380-Pyramimonas_sp.AAC.1
MAIGSETGRKQKTLIFLRFWDDVGLFGASLGSSLATWSRLGAVSGPLGTILGAISSDLALS